MKKKEMLASLRAYQGVAPDAAGVGAYGLTQEAVDELREILWREHSVSLTNEDAWQRATELIAFARMLLDAMPNGRLTDDVLDT